MAGLFCQNFGVIFRCLVQTQKNYKRRDFINNRAFTVWLAALVLLSIFSKNIQANSLNDTGISDCFDDFTLVTTGVENDNGSHPRQDCRYGRDAAAAAGMSKVGGGRKGFDFTKIANNGTVLDVSAVIGSGPTDWACTRDNVTGLVWEVKTTSGLRNQSHNYTWYSSNMSTNGGYSGTESGGNCANTGRCDTEKFVADVNVVGLCGAFDWRMPSTNELFSIVNYEQPFSTIDPNYFPNMIGSIFWSSSVAALNYTNHQIPPSNLAWGIDFYGGQPLILFKYYASAIRLVRTGP